jgi:hypothetical protein
MMKKISDAASRIDPSTGEPLSRRTGCAREAAPMICGASAESDRSSTA